MHTTHTHLHYRKKTQKGASLVELMVGIAIGLLTIATALGALMISHSLTGTVNEVSHLQQQASYAFRIIGQQIRQAGGRFLKPAQSATEFAEFKYSIELKDIQPISGNDDPEANDFTLSIAYQNSADKSYPLQNGNPVERPLLRNCLGENPGINNSPALISQFRLTDNQLICSGNENSQSIISGVSDLRVTYLVQSRIGNTQYFQHLSAEDVTKSDLWKNVYAIEVCLELVGSQSIDTAGTKYTRCDGTTASRDNRLRMVFKNNFYINNHSWNTAS